MRIVRSRVERCGMCADGERDLRVAHPCGAVAAIESRVLLNQAETKVFAGLLWLREQWHENVVWKAKRLGCTMLGRHNITCEGRVDHRVPRRVR